ncbi:MAG: response regulator [Prolixibacteraceae bacterium]|nr:response regulator [Prolixibacteraceae bacterium]
MEVQKIKAIIVDDEKPSRDVLSNYIQENCPSIAIISECDSVNSAYKAIMEYQPDLIFLDIEMPKGNGFDLLKMFKTIDFKIIFITAFSEYAVQAFRFSAIDYLLKPIKISELIEAVSKVKQELATNHSLQNIQALLNNIYSPINESKSLVIPNSKGYSILKTNDIILCTADGYCTHFQLTGNKKISSSRSLKFYEELLPVGQFLRVHRSHIINLQHVKSFNLLGQIFLTEGHGCSLAKGYKESFYNSFRHTK